MNHLHPKLKRLLSLTVVLALVYLQTALSQPTISNTVNTTPQVSGATLTPITGVTNSPEQKISISVFPNPASGSITIQCSNIMQVVNIVDILGRTIKQVQPDQMQVQININDLLPGRYFISIRQQESIGPIIKSFVKI